MTYTTYGAFILNQYGGKYPNFAHTFGARKIYHVHDKYVRIVLSSTNIKVQIRCDDNNFVHIT